jgi:hypothetical protein
MFQAYLAAAFGIWVGMRAFINIGVNMGVLPTKGDPADELQPQQPARDTGLARHRAAHPA